MIFKHFFSNIFVHGCGTGFHKQLMASNSLSLGFSATTMHYVSERPCLIEKHVHMTCANQNEVRLFKDQAEKDWETIFGGKNKKQHSRWPMKFIFEDVGMFIRGSDGRSLIFNLLYQKEHPSLLLALNYFGLP